MSSECENRKWTLVFTRVGALLRLRVFDLAEKILNDSFESATSVPNEIFSWLAIVCYKRSKYAEAIGWLNRGFENRESAPDGAARLLRASAYVMIGDFDSADSDLDQVRVLGLDKVHSYGLRIWAKANQAAGRYSLAIEAYRLLLAHEGTNICIMHALARLLAAAPCSELRDGREAVALAKTVCKESDWGSWKAVSVLAAAYAETGDFVSAVKYANVAVELAPANQKAERHARLDQYTRGEPYRLGPEGRAGLPN